MSDKPVLELRKVSHEYSGRRGIFGHSAPVRAVDEVSMRVQRGDVLGIVGESGSGKSTLAKIMLGLLPPALGEVLLDGRSIAGMTRRQIAERVAFIFQDPYSSLNPRQTVGTIVAYPLYLRGEGTSAQRHERARKILDIVGLPQRFLEAYPNQMSGGQRQRVAIARALISRPKLLICDEPTSALDVSVQAQVLNLLLQLREEFDLTYVMISHNMSVIQHMTTQVAVMYLGRVVEMNVSERIFEKPRHPYTQLLLNSTLTVAPGAGVPDLRADAAARQAMREHPSYIAL
ncbi:ABC transporter ATP-binding protein [Mesorhizobium sp. M1A.F.Ca.IN.020.30.1.1]|uniref:ATP-binding cassette domain-containing protein n=1 Tax=Mesorhizobium sp. M1A.F.Ca.IN.020.30.1.1 TaxID=2496762 RepID=UPI000FD26A0E|nr:ATP-binding cassette domain-containing protein [Mesorhizobium sp. M1A.F.Ca.IN.020.30.1.1]RWG43284.1 MAG: ABC transporter ATP-binding protein [Mesorhizobium sp.]RUV77940.1 ABC transporter ATP-binding protein [Mesorhizobium sp. M1A.F.Ca.IN.020.30.1.1]RWG75457.1 MAG: ABC transporter ATP-binding protein [Mesorhizobium sp.]TIM76259.1 MAG: ATP-binding cassette domain-containing protein [Mesorhizobium sp.]TIM93184.1 MAG: ATP-binding cassette domain-containing protein [Mesorhizobium sp.]